MNTNFVSQISTASAWPKLSSAPLDREQSKNFVELHNQVAVSTSGCYLSLMAYTSFQASVDLLDSLESFFATFQNDLTAVSGQISDLQARSKEFDARLQGRKVSELDLF